MSYRYKRYITYAFITVITLGIPFITIKGKHLLLLSFEKMQFQFLGFSFNVNELFVMPFLLMILFIGIFTITTILGRFWCGWACPQTIFRVIYRDLIESTILDLRKIKDKQQQIEYNTVSIRVKKYISIFLWIVLSLIISSNFMLYFVPPEDFFLYILKPQEHVFMIMFIISTALFLLYDIVFMKEDFCTYLCPYSRIQSSMYDNNTIHVLYNYIRGGKIYKEGEKSIFNLKELSLKEECTTCEACVRVCPTNIDIRKGLQVECINCLECVDACTTVMGKLNKKTLVTWSSTNSVLKNSRTKIFSTKNIMYFIMIALSIIFSFFAIKDKEPFLININKTTKLYKIDGEKVTNNYIITIHNRLEKSYTYELKLNNKNFRIKRFKNLILKDNQRAKTVLIVEATKKLFLSNLKDTPLFLKLIATTKENRDLRVEKTISFIYPRDDSFK